MDITTDSVGWMREQYTDSELTVHCTQFSVFGLQNVVCTPISSFIIIFIYNRKHVQKVKNKTYFKC